MSSVLASVPDRDLKEAVRESLQWENRGVLTGDALLRVADLIGRESGFDEGEAIRQADTLVCREAARRFAEGSRGEGGSNSITEATGMTTDEALAFADEWLRGATLSPGVQGWRIVAGLLAEEVRRLSGENDALRRGEFICHRCGLRKDAEATPGQPDF